MAKDKKISPDDLTKTGKDAPVELQESDLDDASGGIAIIANQDLKIPKGITYPKVEITPNKIAPKGGNLGGNKIFKF